MRDYRVTSCGSHSRRAKPSLNKKRRCLTLRDILRKSEHSRSMYRIVYRVRPLIVHTSQLQNCSIMNASLLSTFTRF